jgi:hypothetical protein
MPQEWFFLLTTPFLGMGKGKGANEFHTKTFKASRKFHHFLTNHPGTEAERIQFLHAEPQSRKGLAQERLIVDLFVTERRQAEKC